MLDLADAKWKELRGGYRIPYDASISLRSLEEGTDVWDELWNELHHQGDVDLASYAAVPHLVRVAGESTRRDWNLYGLVATIEIERHRKTNPALPDWLRTDYEDALKRLSCLASADLLCKPDSATTRAILAVLALANGELKLGALLSGLDTSELDEWLEDRLAWSELYGE